MTSARAERTQAEELLASVRNDLAAAEASVKSLEAERDGLRSSHESIDSLNSRVAELEEQLAAALDAATEARARADEAERRVLDLESLAQDAPSIAGSPEGSASSGGSQEIELRSQLRDLESQLLQSEARARSAYAATEAAEAALRMAKEEGFIPSMHSEQEFRDLRARLEDVTGRADQAERSLAKAEADLAALRAGVDPDALADPLAAVDPVDDAVEPVADPAPSDEGGRSPERGADPSGRRLLGRGPPTLERPELPEVGGRGEREEGPRRRLVSTLTRANARTRLPGSPARP